MPRILTAKENFKVTKGDDYSCFLLRSDELKILLQGFHRYFTQQKKEKQEPDLKQIIDLSPIKRLDDGSFALPVLLLKLDANSRKMYNNEKISVRGNVNT